MRKLSDLERNAFVKMIELIGDEAARDQAIKDIDEGYVEELDNKHILAFHIPNYSRVVFKKLCHFPTLLKTGMTHYGKSL